MTPTAWLAARVAARAARPTVGAAVLGGGWARYAVHRLRGFALTRAAAIALHVVEVLVLVRVTSLHVTTLGLLCGNVAVVLAAAWWGATEVLRERVRACAHRGDVALEVARWRRRAHQLAGLIVGLGAACALLLAARGERFVAGYVVIVAARLAADVVLRVWHAGVAATGRVYRHPALAIGVELLGGALLLGLGRLAGDGGALVALALTALAARLVTWRFVRRAWRRLDLTLPHAGRGPRWPLGPLLRATLAGAATRAPAALAVVALVSPQFPPHVAVGMHLALGVVGLASTWTWAHYHDLVPLQTPGLGALRRRVEVAIAVEALVLGALVGGLAYAAVAWASPPAPPLVLDVGEIVFRAPVRPTPAPFAGAVPLLAVALAALAAVQLVAFCRGRHGVVAVMGVGVVLVAGFAPVASAWASRADAAAAAAAATRATHAWLAGATALVALAGVAALALPAHRRRAPRGEVAWLTAELAARADATGVWHVALGRGGDVAADIAARLVAAGARYVARGGRRLIVAEPAPGWLAAQVVPTGAGWITGVRPWSPPAPLPGAVIAITRGRVVDPALRRDRGQLARIWHVVLAHAAGRASRDGRAGVVVARAGEATTWQVVLRPPRAAP